MSQDSEPTSSPVEEPHTNRQSSESITKEQPLTSLNSSKLSWFSKAGLWSSAQSYLGKLTAAVQEETEGLTLDKVKKDLEEFSQQVYWEVQGLQSAISKESQKQKESNRGVAPDSIVEPLNHEWRTWSQFVSERISGKLPLKSDRKTDNKSGQVEVLDMEHISSYLIPTPCYHLVDPFLSNYRMKALDMQKNPNMFLNMNVTREELQQFYKEMESVTPTVLYQFPQLKEAYERNVPDRMDSTEFWSRYFFKLDCIAKEEMQKQSLLSSNIQNISTKEDVLSKDWSSDEEEQAPIPDTLHIEWNEQDDEESVQEEETR